MRRRILNTGHQPNKRRRDALKIHTNYRKVRVDGVDIIRDNFDIFLEWKSSPLFEGRNGVRRIQINFIDHVAEIRDWLLRNSKIVEALKKLDFYYRDLSVEGTPITEFLSHEDFNILWRAGVNRREHLPPLPGKSHKQRLKTLLFYNETAQVGQPIGWIYLLRFKDTGGTIIHKIGYTGGVPEYRVSKLQEFSPFRLELLAVRPGNHYTESMLHNKAAPFALNPSDTETREWYRFKSHAHAFNAFWGAHVMYEGDGQSTDDMPFSYADAYKSFRENVDIKAIQPLTVNDWPNVIE